MYDDHLRRTGRTQTMLLEAVHSLFYGFNVIVTGYTHRYALDLQNRFFGILYLAGAYPEVEGRNILILAGYEAVFTIHGEESTNKIIDPSKVYLIYNDHFDPDKYVYGIDGKYQQGITFDYWRKDDEDERRDTHDNSHMGKSKSRHKFLWY